LRFKLFRFFKYFTLIFLLVIATYSVLNLTNAKLFLVSDAEATNPPKPIKEVAKEIWEKAIGAGVKCLKGKCKQECIECAKCSGVLSKEAKKILALDRNSDAFAHELGQHLGIPPNNPIFQEGYIIAKGVALDHKKAMGKLADLMEKYPCLEETVKGKGVTLLHGSGSQSLVDLSSGLKPTGQLIQNGKVPFAGELGTGTAGVNSNSISSTSISHMNTSSWGSALSYAQGCGNTSWNPEIGKKNLAEIEAAIAEAAARNVQPGTHTDQMLKNSLAIEKGRIARWEKLSEQEKKLVCNSYPVLYGINTSQIPQDRLWVPKSDCFGEVAVKDGVNWESIKVVYVPANKVEEVTKRLASTAGTKHVEVFPIDTVFTCPKSLRKPTW